MAAGHKHLGAERVVRGEIPRVSADVNVTPLIDILLVLLVIFMAALPITQKGLDVVLPPETQTTAGPTTTDRIVLELTADRRLALNSGDVSFADLEGRLRSVFSQRRDKTMFLMAAGTLRYGEVIKVIDAAHGAGVTRVGVVTEQMRHATGAAGAAGAAGRPGATGATDATGAAGNHRGK